MSNSLYHFGLASIHSRLIHARLAVSTVGSLEGEGRGIAYGVYESVGVHDLTIAAMSS